MGKNWKQVMADRQAGLVPGFRPELDHNDYTRDELVAEVEALGFPVDAKQTKGDLATIANGG